MWRQKASASPDSRSYGSCSVDELHGKCWFWTLYKLLPVEPIGLLGAGAAVCYSDSSPMAPWVIATGCLFSLSSTRAPQNLILLLNVLCQGSRPSLFLLIIFLGPKLLFFASLGPNILETLSLQLSWYIAEKQHQTEIQGVDPRGRLSEFETWFCPLHPPWC